PPRLLRPLNGEETGPVPLTGPASVSSAAQWRSGGSDEELTEGIWPVSRGPSGEGPRRPPSKGDGPAPGRSRPGASRSGAGPGRSARGARPESGTAGIGPVSPTAGSGPVSSSAGVGPVSPARAVGPRPAPSFTRGAGPGAGGSPADRAPRPRVNREARPPFEERSGDGGGGPGMASVSSRPAPSGGGASRSTAATSPVRRRHPARGTSPVVVTGDRPIGATASCSPVAARRGAGSASPPALSPSRARDVPGGSTSWPPRSTRSRSART